MSAVALIVFRESLEAALIVSIVLAASVGIPGRGRWISAGVAGGAAVLREGSETLLFLVGVTASSYENPGALSVGGSARGASRHASHLL